MTAISQLLYLSRGDMAALAHQGALDPAHMVTAIQDMCLNREDGRVSNAPKSAIRPDSDRLFMSTLSVSDADGYMAVKSLGMNAANASMGAEIIGSLITLFDARTAMPLAVMDGDWITAQRTAGLSAVAARYFARPSSANIAFIGCGTQAVAHLDIFNALYPLSEIRALGRGAAKRDALCRHAESLGLSAIPSTDAQDALDGADIVISSVPGSAELTPFVDAARLAPGAFASLVDLGRSWRQDTYGAFDRIVIEDLEQEATMPEPMVDLSTVEGDLGDTLGERIPARQSETDRIAFIFRGLAIADLALAVLVYKRAVEMGVGEMLER